MAIVTGAGSGIGLAIAHALAAEGHQLVVVDIDEAAAEAAVEQLNEKGATALAHAVDIADPEAVHQLATDTEARIGSPRVLVNCAGWTENKPFVETTPEFAERIVAVNLLGAIFMTRALLPAMISSGQGGRVVNVASDAGRVGSSGETVYAGAKGGVIAFTKSLAREMASHEITVNCVCPGPTDTPMLARQPEKFRAALLRAIPMHRLAQPHDIAGAVAFFASDRAAYVTGQVLSVSGGLTMAG